MSIRIQQAVAEAMARLRTSNVAGATTVLRDALGAAAAQAPGRPREGGTAFAGRSGRRLGDVLETLSAARASFASSAARATTRPDDDPRFTSRSLSWEGAALNFRLYVPRGRDRALSLVLMLHGCTQDPDDFARGTRMNSLADEYGLVVAYPHQPRSANANGCWNWFDRRHQSPDSGEPAKLAALAGALTAEFAVDPGRVFAAGLSAGAAMADVLAETHPEVFSKVGLHSGLEWGAANDVVSALAAMKGTGRSGRAGARGPCSRKLILHGTADKTVDLSNGDRLFAGMRSRHPNCRIVVSEVTSSGKAATRQALIDPSGRVLAEYIPIEGAGHAWSGGDTAGSFTDPEGPDASREMVQFFLRP